MTAKTPRQIAADGMQAKAAEQGATVPRWESLEPWQHERFEAAAQAVRADLEAELESVTRDRDKTRADLAAMTVDRDGWAGRHRGATAERDRLAAQLDAVRASRERLLNDMGWIYGYSDDPAVLDRARKAVEAARAEDAEQLPATTPPDGSDSHESGRNLPSAADDTGDTPEAATRLSAPQEGAAS